MKILFPFYFINIQASCDYANVHFMLVSSLFALFILGGRVPADGVTIIQKVSQESFYVTVVFWVLCSCGIIFCLCCLILNFIYQRNR